MNLPRTLVLLFIFINFGYCAFAFTDRPGYNSNKISIAWKQPGKTTGLKSLPLQQINIDTALVVIPFEYKQSTLYHSYTYEVIDSVISLMFKIPGITISIAGFAHLDEGTDTICKWLSIDRAMFIRDYIIGRGIDSSRILYVIAYGRTRPFYKGTDKKGKLLNCRAEITMHYPKPPVKPAIQDRDGDGIEDSQDNCPDEYGYIENKGCPDSAIVVPFDTQQSSLYDLTYQVLDSVVSILKDNPSLTITIQGHAYKEEGIRSFCEELAKQRSNIVKAYLLSRFIAANRIDAIKNFGTMRPLNAGRNPQEVLNNCRAAIILNRH